MHTLPEVALLERAIGYTRGTLATVADDLLDRPTPCAGWSLGRLLDHMADSLEAFTEASAGLVPLDPTPAAGGVGRVELLRIRACALLGAWSATPAVAWVQVGDDRALPARHLLEAAALEITLHGWDVGRATSAGAPVPEALARDLLAVADEVVRDEDRPTRFGPIAAPADVTYAARLLGFSGRRPLQPLPSHPQQGEI